MYHGQLSVDKKHIVIHRAEIAERFEQIRRENHRSRIVEQSNQILVLY